MSLANFAMSSLLASSTAMPNTWNPCGPYCFCRASNQGISILQGWHQVAQKFSSTALPRKSERCTVAPSSDSRANSGAGFPFISSRCSRLLFKPARRAMYGAAASMTEIAIIITTQVAELRFTVSVLFLQRKPVQEGQIVRNQSKPAQHQQSPKCNEQHAAGNLHRMHVSTKPAVKLQKALNTQRRQQERDRQAERVYRQQNNSLHHRILLRGKTQDHRQNRSHARRPSKSKGKANDKRSPGGASPFYIVQPLVGIEHVDLENSGEMQAEENNNDTGCYRQPRFISGQQISDTSRSCTQSHKHDAEPDDEHDRVQHHSTQQLSFLGF